MGTNKETLAELRKRAGRSLRDVAKAVGLSDQQYRTVESGGRGLDAFRVRNMADVLNVSAETIEAVVDILPEETFGQKIAAMRRRVGMEQRELGALMGVGPNQVSRWENGRSAPPLARVEELARIFRCSVADLVQSTDDNSLNQMELAMVEKFGEIPEEEKTRAFAMVMGILNGFAMIPDKPSNDR